MVTCFRNYFEKVGEIKVHSTSINNRPRGRRKKEREIRITERSGASKQHKGKGAGFQIIPRADLSKDVLSMKGAIHDAEPHFYLQIRNNARYVSGDTVNLTNL